MGFMMFRDNKSIVYRSFESFEDFEKFRFREIFLPKKKNPKISLILMLFWDEMFFTDLQKKQNLFRFSFFLLVGFLS